MEFNNIPINFEFFCRFSNLKQYNKTHHLIIVKIETNADDFYDVKSGWIARENYLKNKKPLMAKPTGGLSSMAESVTAHYLQQENPVPSSAIMGNPANSLSSDSPDESSKISGPSGGADALLLFQLTRKKG